MAAAAFDPTRFRQFLDQAGVLYLICSIGGRIISSGLIKMSVKKIEETFINPKIALFKRLC